MQFKNIVTPSVRQNLTLWMVSLSMTTVQRTAKQHVAYERWRKRYAGQQRDSEEDRTEWTGNEENLNHRSEGKTFRHRRLMKMLFISLPPRMEQIWNRTRPRALRAESTNKGVNRRFSEIAGKDNLTVFSYSGRVKSPEWRRQLRRADLQQF